MRPHGQPPALHPSYHIPTGLCNTDGKQKTLCIAMTPVSRVSDRVSAQLLQICSRNSTRAAIPLILAIFLTSLLLNNKVDDRLLNVWTLASCSLVLIRVILLRALIRQNRFDEFRKRILATALTFLLGCTIGSVLYFYPHVGSFERAMLTAILLGLCTASHSTNFGYRPLLLSYIGPLLGTLAVLWIANVDQLLHPALAIAVGVSILIVAQTLLMNGKFMFDAFALSIESSSKLEEQSQHLSHALQVAERAQSEAEASSQSKTRFIAAASHDLRQPVHVLNLLAATLKNTQLDQRSREIVDSMNVAVTSLSSQLNALLDISALDSGAIKPEIQSVNLGTLASTLMLEMKQLAQDKHIELICSVPDGLLVRTDPAMLAQIIRNLCGNAIKYTFSGYVRIQARTVDTQVVLSISDTGIGINDADQVKIFEEFYQISNPGRDKRRGMGLGLSIVERLIHNLGHTIHLSSCVGKGTTVTIDLQRCSLEQMATTESLAHTRPQVVNLPAGFWVHLVDDEDAVQNSVKVFLQSAGCRVTMTATSQESIDFLSGNHPDAVLIDLRLQDDDSGFNVVDWMTGSRPGMAVAVVTGESLTDGSVARRYPDLLMLQKPLSKDALLDLLDYMHSTSLEESTDSAGEESVPDLNYKLVPGTAETHDTD